MCSLAAFTAMADVPSVEVVLEDPLNPGQVEGRPAIERAGPQPERIPLVHDVRIALAGHVVFEALGNGLGLVGHHHWWFVRCAR